MRNPQLVGLVQAVRHLRGVAQGLLRRQRTPYEPLFECFPLQIFHNQKIDAVLMPDIMKGADIRMREFGNGFGFLLQTVSRRGVGGKVCG